MGFGIYPIGNIVNVGEIISKGKLLQELLYGSSPFGYNASNDMPVIMLGTMEDIMKSPWKKEIFEQEGTAKPAQSLDELLARMGQNKPPQ